MTSFRRLILLILDGWGQAPAWGGNAIALAKTPFFHHLASQQRIATLAASGTDVGLEPGHDGNSEVGHLHIGAGRIVPQPLQIISELVRTHRFGETANLRSFLEQIHKNGRRLHLAGLLSQATVHSNVTHLKALIETAKDIGITNLDLHLFLDGRDSDPKDGLRQVVALESYLATLKLGEIRTLIGRSFAMDRNQHWDRTKQTFDLLVYGRGRRATRAQQAVSEAYGRGQTDEFVEPYLIGNPDGPAGIKAGEAIIFFNTRPDRMRQLATSLTPHGFDSFDRGPIGPLLRDISVASLTTYDSPLFPLDHILPLCPTEAVPETFPELLSLSHFRQLHIAETEKYAHVTYFLNGRRESPFPGEDRLLIPSPEVESYDQTPEMRARDITDAAMKIITKGSSEIVIANYANADMVGHTGNFQATLEAVESIDHEVARLAKIAEARQIPLIITADHGNAEEMVNPITGEPANRHTIHPVPCYVLVPKNPPLIRHSGGLIDVAPTCLSLLAIPKSPLMTGQSLLG